MYQSKKKKEKKKEKKNTKKQTNIRLMIMRCMPAEESGNTELDNEWLQWYVARKPHLEGGIATIQFFLFEPALTARSLLAGFVRRAVPR
mgnify:FL=1